MAPRPLRYPADLGQNSWSRDPDPMKSGIGGANGIAMRPGPEKSLQLSGNKIFERSGIAPTLDGFLRARRVLPSLGPIPVDRGRTLATMPPPGQPAVSRAPLELKISLLRMEVGCQPTS